MSAASDSLELAMSNESATYNRLMILLAEMQTLTNASAERLAKANAAWHDDPEADDHAAFHAPASEQFPVGARRRALRDLMSRYIAESDWKGGA